MVYSARTCYWVISMPPGHTQSFLGIPVHLHFVYLNGTDGHPLWLWGMLERLLEFRVSRLIQNVLHSLM